MVIKSIKIDGKEFDVPKEDDFSDCLNGSYEPVMLVDDDYFFVIDYTDDDFNFLMKLKESNELYSLNIKGAKCEVKILEVKPFFEEKKHLIKFKYSVKK